MMKIGRLTWPWEATTPSAGGSVSRRRRHRVEYGLVVAIACFATLSTFNAITAKPGVASTERAAVRYQ